MQVWRLPPGHDKTVMLDGEPALTRAYEGNKGDRMVCEDPPQSKQTGFYHKEHQHGRNVMDNIPEAHNVTLKGELV